MKSKILLLLLVSDYLVLYGIGKRCNKFALNIDTINFVAKITTNVTAIRILKRLDSTKDNLWIVQDEYYIRRIFLVNFQHFSDSLALLWSRGSLIECFY